MLPDEGRLRIVIESVSPEIDGGRFPIKRIVGEQVVVEADIFADGPDLLAGAVLYRPEDADEWAEAPMEALGNDRWRAAFPVTALGKYRYTVAAWLMARDQRRSLATRYERELSVIVDREKARFSTWYEMFPRSCGSKPGRHGTFNDCADRLAYIASMGFDIVYLPPIHPIGSTHRKGKNNTPTAGPDDPGSPWAIGSEAGGYDAIHPQLGTLADFAEFVATAREHGLEVALDIAFQCSPDHPYVKSHPQWFRWRPDGSVQYAENPPKKYEDIYPLNFETEHWRELWEELKRIFLFWVDQGIRIFRVDNPHTKPFRFWEWVIGDIKKLHSDVIFLSEAFTRPKVMGQLSKLGFSQSYTYFAWRNTTAELTEYFTELTQTDLREHFRPSLWPNTPDILTEYLQTGGRPAFIVRLVLAATLGASYGIYGPAFELCVGTAREPGSEEYRDSEKYEIKHWDVDRADSLKEIISRVNRARRENPALQSNANLLFHPVDNDRIICYSKHTGDAANIIVVLVNLNPHQMETGWVDLRLEAIGLDPEATYEMHDLLTDARYVWQGARGYVELRPEPAFRWTDSGGRDSAESSDLEAQVQGRSTVPAHIFRLRQQERIR